MLDPRRHAFRSDLADARLEGQVEAAEFVDGAPMRAGTSPVDMHPTPARDGSILAQCWAGEAVRVFEVDETSGAAWIARERDGYVGYVDVADLADAFEPTHVVCAPRTFVYAEPDLKAPVLFQRSGCERFRGGDGREERGTAYVHDGEGWLIERHVRPLDAQGGDWVAHAATLLHTPYLWGGETAFGIDCSGLVAWSLALAGRDVPRDSDMQWRELGEPLPGLEALARGDLVFWQGHVGIMEDAATLLHANGHTMSVAREPLAEAVERIGYLYGQPLGARRVGLGTR